jgi:hypothetical protein
VLLRIALPLAVPVVLAGVRVAVIFNLSSAMLAAFTNFGGLGDLIKTGIAVNRTSIRPTGGVLPAVHALTVEFPWPSEAWLGHRMTLQCPGGCAGSGCAAGQRQPAGRGNKFRWAR